MRVAVLYHCEQTTHRLDDVLGEKGASVERFRMDLDQRVPADGGFDAVVVLGGSMGAYEEDRHPWLGEEKAWLRALVDAGTPVLGICLGSQLLADVLGGRAYLAERPEAGVVPLRLTEAGSGHPVLSKAGPRVFTLHQDTFELPPGAVLLGQSDDYPQAFQLGSALAVQFHPDADHQLGVEWAKEIAPFLERAGVELVDYQSSLEEAEADLDRESRSLFRAFLETV